MRGRTDIPSCDEALAFEPEEFALVYNLVARQSRDISARRRAGTRVTGGDDSAVATRARGALLADAFAPVRERYKSDPLKYHSAVHRMTALAKLLRGPHLREWMTVTSEGVAVNKAVLAAAATMPLNHQCEFPLGAFIEEVKRRAKCGGP